MDCQEIMKGKKLSGNTTLLLLNLLLFCFTTGSDNVEKESYRLTFGVVAPKSLPSIQYLPYGNSNLISLQRYMVAIKYVHFCNVIKLCLYEHFSQL